MARARDFCEKQHGRKGALAEFLKVRPHMLSAWFAGTVPNGEAVLGILVWLEKQKPGSGAEALADIDKAAEA